MFGSLPTDEHFGADVHDPKARRSIDSQGGFKKTSVPEIFGPWILIVPYVGGCPGFNCDGFARGCLQEDRNLPCREWSEYFKDKRPESRGLEEVSEFGSSSLLKVRKGSQNTFLLVLWCNQRGLEPFDSLCGLLSFPKILWSKGFGAPKILMDVSQVVGCTPRECTAYLCYTRTSRVVKLASLSSS